MPIFPIVVSLKSGIVQEAPRGGAEADSIELKPPKEIKSFRYLCYPVKLQKKFIRSGLQSLQEIVQQTSKEDVEIQKSNVLVVGPTGTETYWLKPL